jgi:hypothetical protein
VRTATLPEVFVGEKFYDLGMHLLFIFVAIGVVCSVIQEILASVFDLRAKVLHNAIRNLLGDKGNVLAKQFLKNNAGNSKWKRVDYISARHFASFLFELLAPIAPLRSRTVEDLKHGVTQLPDPDIRATILGLLDDAKGDIALALKEVEHWFDDSMGLVSSAYKRMALVSVFCIALVMCFALNCDLMMVSRVSAANDLIEKTISENLIKKVQSTAPVDYMNESQSVKQRIAEIYAMMDLPIGWSSDERNIGAFPVGFDSWFFKVLGILASSMLVTIAAVIWFDILNTIINLRISSVPPTQRRLKSPLKSE